MPSRLAAALPLAVFAIAAIGVGRAGINGQDFSQIERGRYLTIAGDCAACHTNKGGAPFAGGLPIETPFGVIVGTNITPDPEPGIGAWTDDEFVRALTRGIRRDGAHLYPAMPYPSFTKVTQDDALAIRAYLSTVTPLKNAVKADQLPFPLKIRADMAAWNELYFTPGAYQPVAGKSAEWNRGSYLVEGLMHCGVYHTAKNIAGADKSGERLQGSVLQGWFAPDITNAARHGLAAWSVDDIVAYLKTGHNAFAAASGPMADEVSQSSSKMTEADLRAVAVYLNDQPGAAVYRDECSACHTPEGSGVPELFPCLAGSPAVQSADPTSLIRVVIAGTRSVATDKAPTAPVMPSLAWALDDRAIAAVLTYIRNSSGNAAPAVEKGQVTRMRKDLAERAE